MASRVNTKFVILLSVAILVMLALVGVAYAVVKKSGAEHEASGDKMMAEGDYEKAKMFYGKAVSKDRSRADWMGKWINAMEHLTPETETAYRDAFNTDYIAGLSAMSTIYRTDVEAHRKILDVFYDMVSTNYTRGGADTLITMTTKALTYFDNHPADDTQWQTLRRFRGLAYDRIVQSNGVIDDDQFALYREDLDAAVRADPTDSLARVALIRWGLAEAMRNRVEGDTEMLHAAQNKAVEDCNAALVNDSANPVLLAMKLSIMIDIARESAGLGLEDAERTTAIVNAFKVFLPELDELSDALMQVDPASVTTMTIDQFLRVENAISPESAQTRTLALMESLVSADPTNAELLWTSARIFERSGHPEEAIAHFQEIIGLDLMPLSFDGWMLFTRKRQSLVSIADIKMNQYQLANATTDENSRVRTELITEVEAIEADFAQQVSEDNDQLLMLRGRLTEAKGDLNSALSLYKKYNEQTKRQYADGLWREGIVAHQLGQLGTARTAMRQVIAIKRYDMRAMLALADIEMRLNNHRDAAEQYERILVYDPNNELALQGIKNARAIEDPMSLANENPALALILTARQLRLGTDGQPGDLSSAIELLSNGISTEVIDYEPSVARELAMLLMDNGDIVGARATLVQSSSRNPDDEKMVRLVEAMQGDDPVDILVTLIRQGEQPVLEQNISIANIYLQKGRLEEFDSVLATLQQNNPEDRRVIELSFARALQLNDVPSADRLAQQATTLNIDNVRGLTFKARLESFKQDHEKAIRILQQAAALGTADASVYRMLAMEQRVLGQIDSSAESFQQALAIRPNDFTTIYEYVATLTRAGRFQNALEVARANQQFGISDSGFNNLWLMLEANYGGDEGRDFAIRQRERMLELNSSDIGNRFELARMYISSKRWDDSKLLIDTLRAEGDQLPYVELEAQWYADQGRVGKSGGMRLAREVYREYIDSLGDDLTDAPFISMARFMLDRGRPDLATQAANAAVQLENPATMEGSKLHGDLQMMINQFDVAAEDYLRVLEADADPDDTYRAKLIEAFLRLRRYDEALSQLDELPEDIKNSKIAMLQRAEVLNGLDKITESRDVLNTVVAKYSDDPIVFIKRAESLIGDTALLSDLLADVDQALNIDANDWRAYRVRAAAYFAVDRRTDALRDLQSAVRINPNLDSALFGVLNELINDNRAGEALDLAKEALERRSNDAPLMTQIGHIFAARRDWNRACEMYAMAWNKRRSPSDGATYIDALVRRTPPNTEEANAVIRDLGELAEGGIEQTPGLLAAQALVLDARGRADFAIQQVTKAFDLSLDDDQTLSSWYSNVARFFEDRPVEEQVAYLDSIRRRKNIPQVQAWIDLFISQALARHQTDTARADMLLTQLMENAENPRLQRLAFQSYGSLLFSMDNYEKALNVWIEGIKIFPDDWEMNNNIAFTLSDKLDRNEDALAYAESAIDMEIRRSEPYETAARIYTRLERFEDANEMIQMGIRYALSIESRVTMINADARMKIAMGELEAARAQVLRAKSVLRSLPGQNEEIENTIKEIEDEIASAG